jgi:alpha-mannosidase II
MSDLYETLAFDNKDGGAWKQGFEIQYDQKQWNAQKKLKVIIVPHSHNDPGWLLTFEDYFKYNTKHILDAVVVTLTENSNRTFIWSEISYLALWWKSASKDMRKKLKYLVTQTKQLEIVTGGWVMNDEANTNYYAMIEQMVLGHEWLRLNLKTAKPVNGWAIDPFGYSPTMAYILKRYF